MRGGAGPSPCRLLLLVGLAGLLFLLRRLCLLGLTFGSGLGGDWLRGGGGVFAGALALLDASGLAREVAQVIEARLVHATTREHFDLVDVGRVVRKDALDADAVADLAD